MSASDGLIELSIHPLLGERSLSVSHQLTGGDYSLIKAASTAVAQHTRVSISLNQGSDFPSAGAGSHICAPQAAYSARTAFNSELGETDERSAAPDEPRERIVASPLDPDPGASHRRDPDVTATALRNVNELAGVGDVGVRYPGVPGSSGRSEK